MLMSDDLPKSVPFTYSDLRFRESKILVWCVSLWTLQIISSSALDSSAAAGAAGAADTPVPGRHVGMSTCKQYILLAGRDISNE